MENNTIYPVIDLFAGPGGLGEGFGSLCHPRNPNSYAFKTSVSIEKDESARSTLKLRHFYRGFTPGNVPDDYYLYLEGVISLEELYKRHPAEASHAEYTAWRCTLGGKDGEPHENVKTRITQALNGHKKWALVGGPPCQAYSKVGRSRMKGIPGFEDDPRHFLYKEYLRIIIDHRPPVFVMENVRGLISSQVQGRYVINDILRDLNKPGLTLKDESSDLEYRLYSLSQSGVMSLDADPNAFIVKAEEYGIPQARHRIFILGIRSDIDIDIEPRILKKSNTRTTVKDMIGDLPRLRSSISGSASADSDELWVKTLEEVIHQSWFTDGGKNGLAELTTIADEVLSSFKEREFEKSSKRYTPSAVLWDWLRDNRLTVLLSHESRSHMQSDLHRYFFAALYAQVKKTAPKLRDFPKELLPEHKNAQQGGTKHDFADRFRVQLPNKHATTITSHISKDGHYYIHYDPEQCRSLTVREAARLQTFPDNYKFQGNRTEQYHQVGNAVPPLLASMIAEVVFDVLERIE